MKNAQRENKCNMKKVTRVKYGKKVHKNSALVCTNENGPHIFFKTFCMM